MIVSQLFSHRSNCSCFLILWPYRLPLPAPPRASGQRTDTTRTPRISHFSRPEPPAWVTALASYEWLAPCSGQAGAEVSLTAVSSSSPPPFAAFAAFAPRLRPRQPGQPSRRRRPRRPRLCAMTTVNSLSMSAVVGCSLYSQRRARRSYNGEGSKKH